MRPAGPGALLAAAVALAVVGVGLLLPVGRPGGQQATASGSDDIASPAPAAVVTSPVATASAPVVTSPTATVPARDGTSPTPTVPAPVGSPPAATSPADRLAGPVTDEEVAQAFVEAVPAAQGVDPALSLVLIRTAADGLTSWYGDAGWRDIRVQAAVVTTADGSRATVSALWSGAHPVLGDSDRRLAAVDLTAVDLTGGSGPAWTVEAVEGGPAHG